MIDSYFRSPYQKRVIHPLLKWNFLGRVPPAFLTLLGLATGLLIPFFLAWHLSILAFISLIASGFLDTLDGSVARSQNHTSNRGAVFDILSDRSVEWGVILGFYFYDPSRSLLCLLMMGSILLCITSFLVVGVFQENSSEKSFHYSPGLIERAEAFIFFALMILMPQYFSILATLFVALVLFTAIQRTYQFKRSSLS